MQGRKHSSAGSVLISPSHRHSGSRRRNASAARVRLTGSASSSAQRTTRARSLPSALAHRRETAAGRPVTTGVMSSICALCASSTSPIACAPNSRESHSRSRKPMERTTKCDALKKSVF